MKLLKYSRKTGKYSDCRLSPHLTKIDRSLIWWYRRKIEKTWLYMSIYWMNVTEIANCESDSIELLKYHRLTYLLTYKIEIGIVSVAGWERIKTRRHAVRITPELTLTFTNVKRHPVLFSLIRIWARAIPKISIRLLTGLALRSTCCCGDNLCRKVVILYFSTTHYPVGEQDRFYKKQ